MADCSVGTELLAVNKKKNVKNSNEAFEYLRQSPRLKAGRQKKGK